MGEPDYCAFVDGNKRIAFAATYTFLAINGVMFHAPADEAYAFISSLYEANSFRFEELTTWLRANSGNSTLHRGTDCGVGQKADFDPAGGRCHRLRRLPRSRHASPLVLQEDAGPMSDTKFVPPPSQNFLALPVDTVIGRYRITGILGQGSFGITYRAHDGQLGRDVAIKEYLPTSFAMRHDGLTVLPNSTATAEDFAWGRQRFVEEGRTLAGFQRAPGIVRVHDFLEANGTAYIVMELATGETLGARLQRQGRLAAAEVERILRALLDGLEKVHAASFIHRDIKPDNILLDDEGQPTLIDFGAARAAVAGRTAALTGIFTPGYAAVEQFADGRQGPFTDIYALSATLHQSITGEKPPSAIDRVLEDKYVPLAKRRPAGFAPALLAGIDRGMAVRPEARPQTIAAWRAVLFPGETREKPIPAQAPEKPTRWRVAAIAGLATVLVAGAAAGALFLFAPQKAPVTDADRQQAERSAAAAATATAEKRRAEEETQRQAAAACRKATGRRRGTAPSGCREAAGRGRGAAPGRRGAGSSPADRG